MGVVVGVLGFLAVYAYYMYMAHLVCYFFVELQ